MSSPKSPYGKPRHASSGTSPKPGKPGYDKRDNAAGGPGQGNKPWRSKDSRPSFDSGRNKAEPAFVAQQSDRAERQEAQGPDLVFGLHAVDAVLRHHHNNVEHLLIQEGRNDPRMENILARAQRVNIRVEKVDRAVLDEQANGVHQGVIAVCRQLHLERSEAQLKELLDSLDHPPFLLILDGVTDPHNLGACLRSAEAAGVDGVIVPKDKSALLNATSRKVACGAAEVIPFFAVTNLVRTVKDLQERGIWIFGAAGEATAALYQTDLRGPVALVMGSEGTGMRRLTRESCDALFSIPMAGEVSSLNVSVSAGVCLFEAVRQRAGK